MQIYLWESLKNSKTKFSYLEIIIAKSQFSRVRNLPGDSNDERRELALKKRVIINSDDRSDRIQCENVRHSEL